ncbi:MAG: signal recognition particle-docking protein FtsY [Dehalococcoidia bacterium]|nr:signal recognition particle-docking protein FtsY [Dehalococcoidia bacterium]
MPLNFLRRKQKTEEGLKKSREGIFSRLRQAFGGRQLSATEMEQVEELLLAADVGVGTTQKLMTLLQAQDSRAPEERLNLLKKSMLKVLQESGQAPPFPGEAPAAGVRVILVVGVNGAGKTTTIAKLAHLLKEDGYKPILAAADTFRAAATEQLQVWGQRAGVEVVAHRPGADPGAVVFDAYKAAQARGSDVLIVDTAGRLHTKHNLMEELKKVWRVLARLDPTAPHQTLLVLDATTGQNGLAQAKAFTEAVKCTGIVLAKLDGTAKGGIVFSIAEQTKLPVLFIGTGEGIDDLAPFDPEEFVEGLFGSARPVAG